MDIPNGTSSLHSAKTTIRSGSLLLLYNSLSNVVKKFWQQLSNNIFRTNQFRYIIFENIGNGIKLLFCILGYLDTWSGFETDKTDPWSCWGLHHFGKFLEPSDELAGRGCCCFLMRWHSWAFWAHQEWAPENCRAQIWSFQF